jgi:hypothetical protein
MVNAIGFLTIFKFYRSEITMQCSIVSNESRANKVKEKCCLTVSGRMVPNGHMKSVFLSDSLMLTMHNFSNTLIITLVRPDVNSSIRTNLKPVSEEVKGSVCDRATKPSYRKILFFFRSRHSIKEPISD